MPETNGRAERVVQHSRAIGHDISELRGELSAAARELGQKVDMAGTVREHPFATVLVAAGIGYVLGGGLFTPLTRRLVGIGTRALLLPIVRGQLASATAQGQT